MTFRFPFATLLAVALFSSCPPPVPVTDGGPVVVTDAGADAGSPPPPSCGSPVGCAAGTVCRASHCVEASCDAATPCGAGESCVGGTCTFTGCRSDGECPGEFCDATTFACRACNDSAECPAGRPLCAAGRGCVACETDAQCPAPGLAHCSLEGACAQCLNDAHCPNGLTCNAQHVCEGASEGQTCGAARSCGVGLTCVQTGGPMPVCLRACELFSQSCMGTEVCHPLIQTRTDWRSFLFGEAGPLGVCRPPVSGSRMLGQPCARTTLGSNCQPNLWCVPDSATTAACRAFCDPRAAMSACGGGERCVGFTGDLFGREYGLCLPDDGFGARCSNDATCSAMRSCQPYEDPHSLNNLSTRCQYDVGASPGLAPCGVPVVPDGGQAADQSCASGRCVADQASGSQRFFCFSACTSDAECSVGTRRGLCDHGTPVSTTFGVAGTVRGCRPTCDERSDCLEYGSGYTCRSLLTRNSRPSFVTTCGLEAASAGPGEPCYAGYQCRSGYCSLDDGRGAQREGFCSEACTSAAQCVPTMGAPLMPMDCADTPVMGFYGFDGKGGTSDDVLFHARLCTGATCTQEADCGGGTTGTCTPDVDPMNTGSAMLQRCKPANPGGKVAGETCQLDIECRSSACGRVTRADGGVVTMCFEACTPASTCTVGTTCRPNAMAFSLSGGEVLVTSCVP